MEIINNGKRVGDTMLTKWRGKDMRWKRVKHETPEIRYKRKFAILPMMIGDQTRWLETVLIEQKPHRVYDPCCGEAWVEWQNIRFVEG
jgi:hypothetical protein